MQGIHYQSKELQEALATEFPQPLLMNMAGNAFHVWCCAAVVVATLRLHAEARARLARIADDLLEDVWGVSSDVASEDSGEKDPAPSSRNSVAF